MSLEAGEVNLYIPPLDLIPTRWGKLNVAYLKCKAQESEFRERIIEILKGDLIWDVRERFWEEEVTKILYILYEINSEENSKDDNEELRFYRKIIWNDLSEEDIEKIPNFLETIEKSSLDENEKKLIQSDIFNLILSRSIVVDEFVLSELIVVIIELDIEVEKNLSRFLGFRISREAIFSDNIKNRGNRNRILNKLREKWYCKIFFIYLCHFYLKNETIDIFIKFLESIEDFIDTDETTRTFYRFLVIVRDENIEKILKCLNEKKKKIGAKKKVKKFMENLFKYFIWEKIVNIEKISKDIIRWREEGKKHNDLAWLVYWFNYEEWDEPDYEEAKNAAEKLWWNYLANFIVYTLDKRKKAYDNKELKKLIRKVDSGFRSWVLLIYEYHYEEQSGKELKKLSEEERTIFFYAMSWEKQKPREISLIKTRNILWRIIKRNPKVFLVCYEYLEYTDEEIEKETDTYKLANFDNFEGLYKKLEELAKEMKNQEWERNEDNAEVDLEEHIKEKRVFNFIEWIIVYITTKCSWNTQHLTQIIEKLEEVLGFFEENLIKSVSTKAAAREQCKTGEKTTCEKRLKYYMAKKTIYEIITSLFKQILLWDDSQDIKVTFENNFDFILKSLWINSLNSLQIFNKNDDNYEYRLIILLIIILFDIDIDWLNKNEIKNHNYRELIWEKDNPNFWEFINHLINLVELEKAKK